MVLAGVLLLGACSSSSSSPALEIPKTPASAPFAAFIDARVAVGDDCLRVLVASSEEQRVQGLRDVTDFGAYDGMLFVFPNTTSAKFTMANTPMPLDIGWYASDGAPVDHTTMEPCPEGTDSTCPAYASDGKYRFALETARGGLGSGSLGGCAS